MGRNSEPLSCDKKGISRLGADGEAIAASFLLNKGYKILFKNWRHKHLEIDIIAKSERYLVFVEVKTRSGTLYGQPSEAVGYAKQKRLLRAAQAYLEISRYEGEVRFDILSLVKEKKSLSFQIEHIQDAFWG